MLATESHVRQIFIWNGVLQSRTTETYCERVWVRTFHFAIHSHSYCCIIWNVTQSEHWALNETRLWHSFDYNMKHWLTHIALDNQNCKSLQGRKKTFITTDYMYVLLWTDPAFHYSNLHILCTCIPLPFPLSHPHPFCQTCFCLSEHSLRRTWTGRLTWKINSASFLKIVWVLCHLHTNQPVHTVPTKMSKVRFSLQDDNTYRLFWFC